MSSPKTYQVHPVAANDENEIMDLLKRTFFTDEPLNMTVKLYETGSCPELEEYCRESLLQRLSLKAVSPEGKIVGVIVNGKSPLKEDENDSLLNQAIRCPNPKFQKILYILAKREEGAKLWEKYPNDEFMVDVKMVATHRDWRRRGIMNALLRATDDVVRQQGLRVLRMDTSSAYSARSAKRQGFTCVYSALYQDIKLNGQPLIVPEPPHVEDGVYIKIISN